jgi:hypothetical protein
MLRGRLEYSGAVLTSPIQLATSKGTANLDIVSGRKVEKLLAAVREESLCSLWKDKINAWWAQGQEEGRTYMKIADEEEVDEDQNRRQESWSRQDREGSCLGYLQGFWAQGVWRRDAELLLKAKVRHANVVKRSGRSKASIMGVCEQ